MIRHVLAALAAVGLLAACTSAPTPSPTPPPKTAASGWTEVPEPHGKIDPAELAVDPPLRFPEGDPCALLTEQEIVTTARVPHARTTTSSGPDRCTWQVGDGKDDRGRQWEQLILDRGVMAWWGGPERGEVAGRPARRLSEEGKCVLRVALHRPADDTDDRPVLQVSLRQGNPGVDTCAGAQALAELLLARMTA
ncbi:MULTISPECIES: DUF3558 family protein [unclassified Saccharothrix]|uniref:DUF3558 family protein n=1 Tax=unclassified Saccharothrix TaxID=2593673 RepID=UPI00307CECC9